ncbi:MAG: phenylacetate--CoA ligase family protein, partial [Candidatus Bathyarchaeia archaeon]
SLYRILRRSGCVRMKYFEPDMERMSREQVERLQDKELRHVISRAYQRVKMYHDRFEQLGLHSHDLDGLKDLEKVPYTTKNDLRSYPLTERLAVPEMNIVRYFSSSGTTGRPVAFGFTLKDLEVGAVCCAKTFTSATISREDKVLEPIPSGLYSVTVAQKGLEKIGAKVIHTGPGRTKELQIPMLSGEFEKSMRPTAMIASASYAMRIAEVAEEVGKKPREFGLKKLVCGVDMWSESKRRILQEAYGAPAFDVFGLIEASGGPAVAAECEEHQGLHVWENYFLVEVIDPETGERLGEGEEGELVITGLQKDAHPIVRYRTGDITKIFSYEKCACGRTNMRIGRIAGRTDDRVKVRGVQLYPNAVEEALLSIPGVGSEYQVVIREAGGIDEMLVKVEGRREDPIAPDLSSDIADYFKGVFNITPTVEVVPHGKLPRISGTKVKRFLDLRPRS